MTRYYHVHVSALHIGLYVTFAYVFVMETWHANSTRNHVKGVFQRTTVHHSVDKAEQSQTSLAQIVGLIMTDSKVAGEGRKP